MKLASLRAVAYTIAVVLLAVVVDVQAQATAPLHEQFTLTKRQEGGAYGGSAFSFRYNSQDLAVHDNYVDLLFSNCGLLHFNPVGGMSSRATDLGEGKLDGTPRAAGADAKWFSQSVRPEVGHVYLLEINADDQRSLVKFRIDEVQGDSVKISWTAIDLTPPPQPAPGDGKRGRAGEMGLCGGGDQPR